MRLLFRKNYLTQIENAAKGENHMFRNFYVEKESKVGDTLKNGGVSCGVMVSHIIYSFNPLLEVLGKKQWLRGIHLTVASTEKDLLESGWYEIDELKPGAVVVWEKKDGSKGEPHNHIGFYVGGDMAVSNDSRGTGFPHKHHYTYNNTRKIEKIYWHDALND
ncbi:MAG: hypothetical protein HYX22_01840 [Candidatus Yanofskybacteria bacterium]|nr:hypothetical protein [Candidatus Yanofskybacteria bacterium]